MILKYVVVFHGLEYDCHMKYSLFRNYLVNSLFKRGSFHCFSEVSMKWNWNAWAGVIMIIIKLYKTEHIITFSVMRNGRATHSLNTI
jgi:hypothetical protein